MLVLSRKLNEIIVLKVPGLAELLQVQVVEIRGDKVRLGITAPQEVAIHRLEVQEHIDALKKHNMNDKVRRDGNANQS